MSDLPEVSAPFTPDQVASLNAYQSSPFFHQFTCGNRFCPGAKGERPALTATESGWGCTGGCGYTQDWAHAMMADWSWRTDGLASELSRFAVRIGGGPPVRGEIVTIEVESACCGADASWRESYGRLPWECASCGDPCEVRAVSASHSPVEARPADGD